MENHLPAVHLNGSGVKNLTAPADVAELAIRSAIVALRDAAPHMRDFYPLPDADARYGAARDVYRARLRVLEVVAAGLQYDTAYIQSLADSKMFGSSAQAGYESNARILAYGVVAAADAMPDAQPQPY